MIKIKQIVLASLISAINMPVLADDEYTVRYEFSVLFLAKTCEINVPSEIIFGNQSGVTTVNEIKNDSVSESFTIGLKNCSTPEQNSALVYLASGKTINGTDNFFNDNPNGVIGVQLLDGNRVIKVNKNPLSKPDAASVIWDNITSVNETKQVSAKLRCVIANCEPEEGDFTATLTIGYYAD